MMCWKMLRGSLQKRQGQAVDGGEAGGGQLAPEFNFLSIARVDTHRAFLGKLALVAAGFFGAFDAHESDDGDIVRSLGKGAAQLHSGAHAGAPHQ